MLPRPAPQEQSLLAEALKLAKAVPTETELAAEPEQSQARQERLLDIRAQLTQFAHPLQASVADIRDIPESVRLTFSQACILLSHYPHLGAAQWYGTIQPQTLQRFQPEAIPPALTAPDALEKLWDWFALPAETLSEFKHELTQLETQLHHHHRVIHRLRQAIQETSLLTVFQAIFGELPIPPECLAWGSTDWQLYFCLSYEEGCLCTWDQHGHPNFQAWNQLTPDGRTDVQAFLEKLNQFNYEKFDRFPIFGACEGSQINWAWLQQIAADLSLSPSQVTRVLTRSVSILPAAKVEAFLIHDIWGHHWQLWLTSFLNDYEFLSDCGAPLWPGETAYTPHGPLACRELFCLQQGQVRLESSLAKLFFHGEVQQRLGFLFTHLLGEMLADVAEFKFACHFPDDVDCLQSSSVFAQSPTKLDLSLLDIDFLFLRVLKPLLEVNVSIFEASPLEIELQQEWHQAPGQGHSIPINELTLKSAIAELYQVFFQEFQSYAPNLDQPSGLFAAMICNLLYLQNAVDSLYHHPLAESEIPLRDLLLVFIGCYCSQDCYQEFWTIDDVLATYFLPCCQYLQSMDRAITP